MSDLQPEDNRSATAGIRIAAQLWSSGGKMNARCKIRGIGDTETQWDAERYDRLTNPLIHSSIRCFTHSTSLIHTFIYSGGHSMDWPMGWKLEKSWSADISRRFLTCFTSSSSDTADTGEKDKL